MRVVLGTNSLLDNKFVDCALNGRADFLVSDDRHFNILKKIGFPPVTVIRTEEFLEKLLKEV